MRGVTKTIEHMRNDAVEIFYAGLQAVDPATAVKKFCHREGGSLHVGDRVYDLSRVENLFVIGAGKASAPMAAAVEDLVGEKITGGMINVKYGHVAELKRIRQVEAGHPVPDKNGESGAREIINISKAAGKKDLVLCLFSGGGSALLPLPAEGLSLTDKQEAIKVLLSCGATIHEINAIRKHTSGIKGGRLAYAIYPASLVSLILSDVVGDNLDVIASGPTVPDASTFSDCMAIFNKYRITGKLPKKIVCHIQAGMSGEIPETPKSGDRIFANNQNLIVGSNHEAIVAAREKAVRLGYHSLILSSMIEGETRHVAHVHGAIAREILKTGNPVPSPACILSGGETTVTISGNGLGGRCQEFALAAAMDIDGFEKIVILGGGTDGTDGPTDAAGALVDSNTLKKAANMGLDPMKFLANNDAYHFFKSLGDLFITGPTKTNVMDLRIVLAA